jgi:dicarboxylate transporter DctA-like protein
MRARVGRPSSHKFALMAAAIMALIGLIAAAPLLFGTQLGRLALSYLFPRNRPTLRFASISLSGRLIMRELQLHDVGASADRPLVAIHELRADFRWADLLSRRIRQIRLNQVTVYARSNDASQLSLLDLLGNFASSGSDRSAAPFWIDALVVTGTIHGEVIAAFSEADGVDWPLLLSMTMSGDRRYPARQINLRIGDPVATTDVAVADHQTVGSAIGLRVEAETHPTADGTHLIFHRVVARNAALVFDADMARKLVVNLPRELEGRIEAGLAYLSAAGELDLPAHGSGKLSGSVSFADVRVRAPGKSQLMLSLDDMTGSVKVDSPLPPGTATSINVVRIEAQHSSLSVDAEAIRRYAAKLPAEISGRIEVSIGNLTTSGELSPRGPAKEQRFAADLTISGARIHVPGVSQSLLDMGDLSGGGKIDTPLPMGNRAVIMIDDLKVRNVIAAFDADAMRKYISKLPSDIHGPVNANLEELDLAGSAGLTPDGTAGIRGIWNVRLQDLNAKSRATGAHTFSLDRLSAAGIVESRREKWASAKVRSAVTRFAAFTYGTNSISNLDATWHDDGRVIECERCALEIFGGTVSGSPAFDLVSHEIRPCDLEVRAIDVHRALANLSPEHIDADGNVSGVLHLNLSKQGELSGNVELAFDGPGLLKIGEIEEVKRMLIGNFGLDMANLAMHDLRHFPFKQGSLQLQSIGESAQLKIKFVRQARTAADMATPHKEMINGKEVLVRSLVVPSIDMTIPITGESLAEILATVSGLTPTLQAASGQGGK